MTTSDKPPRILARTFTSIILYRDYRFFWMGSWTEHLGEWMETTALLWLLNQLTNSPFMGTLMVTLRFLPMVVFAFIGGILADRYNRRHILMFALLASAAISITLAVVVHLNLVRPWHILLYSVSVGIINSFNHPARNTLLPNLVAKEHFLNAITLDNTSVMASRIIATPLAGLIISLAGTTPVLGVRAAGAFLAMLWLAKIRNPATPSVARRETALHNLVEGLVYVRSHKNILTQILLNLLPVFVNNTYTGLLPYFATNYLHIGPRLYGVLQACPGAGALISAFTLASRVRLRRKRMVLLLGGIVQGFGLIIFALTASFWSALFILVIIGGANTTFMTLNNTLIQEMLPDQMRGRVMSLREVSFGFGPSGSLISGAIAASLGVPLALIFAGGVSIVVLLSILVGLRQTWQHRS